MNRLADHCFHGYRARGSDTLGAEPTDTLPTDTHRYLKHVRRPFAFLCLPLPSFAFLLPSFAFLCFPLIFLCLLYMSPIPSKGPPGSRSKKYIQIELRLKNGKQVFEQACRSLFPWVSGEGIRYPRCRTHRYPAHRYPPIP